MNTRNNNLRIYYIEKAKAEGVECYNYQLFAKDINIPYSSTKRYLDGGNMRDSVCRKIEQALLKPEGDLDTKHDKVKWPLEFGYWNHPTHKRPHYYYPENEGQQGMVAEVPADISHPETSQVRGLSYEQQQELRVHLLKAFTLEELDRDEIISKFARFGEI